MIEQLTERTEQLEEQIAELEQEQKQIRPALGAAINAFDEKRIAELQQRRTALPGEIIATKIAYQRAVFELAAARQEADNARLAEITQQAAPIHAQIVALQEQIGPLVMEATMIGSREMSHRDRKNAARRKLELLLAERADMLTTDSAPVVRNFMYMPRMSQ